MYQKTIRVALFYLLLLSPLLIHGQSQDDAVWDKLRHIAGRWRQRNTPKNCQEIWRFKSDILINGKSIEIEGLDTTVREVLSIEPHGGDIFYIAKVKGQNQELPVSFQLTFFTGHKWVFENPRHDFPTRIEYQIHRNRMLAIVSGPAENKDAPVLEFRFKRIRDKKGILSFLKG